MTIFSIIKKTAIWTVGLIAGLYLVFAVGLIVLNTWVPMSTHPEEAVFGESKSDHQFTLLTSGIHSLHARLKLIEEAKESIELEFFIYNLDVASRILTQALVKKAEAGVKVRILVDFAAPVFQLKPVYARYLKTKGVDVRYYNTSAAYRLVSSQHRSHRKMLIVDGSSVITGGRNIADEYFDLAAEYNFLDTDVLVRGPLAESMRRSFDLYWASDFSRESEGSAGPLTEDEMRIASKFVQPGPNDESVLAKISQEGSQKAKLAKVHTCSDTVFVTDFPNQGEHNRKVYRQILNELASAQNEVIAESPYFVIRPEGYEAIENLTNSLYSTDAFYTVAPMLFRMKWLAQSNMTLNVFNGRPVIGQSPEERGGEGRWGIHSKRAVIDGQTVMIGTYNIDPRSANLNSELMLVCRNQPEFAAEVLADLNVRFAQSSVAIENGDWRVAPILHNASFGQLVLTAVSVPLATLFDFLL